jgi:hypothetical protein
MRSLFLLNAQTVPGGFGNMTHRIEGKRGMGGIRVGKARNAKQAWPSLRDRVASIAQWRGDAAVNGLVEGSLVLYHEAR